MSGDLTWAQLLGLNLPLSGATKFGFIGGKNVVVNGTIYNDSLRSGGSDTMVGGLGDDTYNVLGAGDVVVEQPNQGIDTVKSNVNFVLSDNVENLSLLGSSGTGKGLFGTGNGLDNRIFGDTGIQFINGGAGNDMLTGGGGADTFIVENGNGSDLITDFGTDDLVNLQGYAFSSFSAVLAAMTQVGNDVVLQLSATEALGFKNVQLSSFTSSQFKLQLDTGDLVQTFGDEFNNFSWYNGTSGTWRTVFKGGGISGRTLSNNHELQIYTDQGFGPNPFSVSNGVLTITATNTPASQLSQLGNYAYTSGVITSKFSHSQLYGVFEIRAQMPAVTGAWPAFWLIPTDNSSPAELDVFEQYGATPDQFFTTIHTGQSGHAAGIGQTSLGATTTGFHTYTVDWEPDFITWYFDGNAIFRQATPTDMHVPMYMIANVAVGGPYAPAAGAFNAQMQIDYIHASQHGHTITGTGSNDVFNVTSILDIVVEQSGGSNNIVNSSIDYLLPANVQTLVLTGTADINGFANEKNSTITGNAGANLLEGNIGNDTLLGGAGNDKLDGLSGDDTLIDLQGSNTLVGNLGTDTATGFDSSWHLSIANNQWVVTNGTDTDTLNGVEEVVIAGVTYFLVDQFTNGKGGFASVQAAIDAAPATGGVTILIAPGTYDESALTTEASQLPSGLYIYKPNLILQGVKADGSWITSAADAQIYGASIKPTHQNELGINHFIGAAATGTVIAGLHLQAGAETTSKLVEVWADNVTFRNDYIYVGGQISANAEAIDFNGDLVNSYTVDHNILSGGITIANGVGDPAQGIGPSQQITNNQFIGNFDPTLGFGRYDAVTVNGPASQIPTIQANTFSNNTAPLLFSGSDVDPANLPGAALVQQLLASNGSANTTWAYALTPTGQLELATLASGSSAWAVARTIDTLNLALDATADPTFPDQRQYIHAGDTLMVQSGSGALSSQIMVDGLTVLANANSANLNLTLASTYADGSPIPNGGVQSLSLADYAAGQGANVDVAGNGLDNLITGNSGANILSGGGGNDTLDGTAGADTAAFSGNWVDYAISTTGAASDTTVVQDSQSGRDGSDSIANVETFKFANGAFSIALIANDAPVAADDAAAVIEAGALADGTPTAGVASAGGNVLANDSDPDAPLGDTHTVTGVRTGDEASGGTLQSLSGATVIQGVYGALTIQADGSYGYVLDNANPATQALAAGQTASDVFTYQVSDAHGLTDLAQLSVSIVGTNDAPIASGGSGAVDEDGVLNGTLPAASDVEGDGASYALAADAAHGAAIVNADGSFSYTPGADFNGSDSFSFSVLDANGGFSTYSYDVAVAAVNDAPVAADGSAAGAENTVIAGLAGASDVDGQALSYALVTGPQNGTLTFNPDGSYSYTPATDYYGPDGFTFTASDGSLTSNVGAVSLMVSAPPAAADAAASGAEDTIITGQASATDPDSASLTYALVAGPQHGSLTFNPDGSYSYAPGADYNGSDNFTFTASDGSLSSNTATVSLTVDPVNDAPVAADGATAGNQGMVANGQAVANDVDSASLTYALVGGPQHGTLTFNPDGSYNYTPFASFSGADSFTFSASDGQLDSNVATVSLTVNGAPVAADSAASGAEDGIITGQAAASDTDSPSLTYALVSGPQHGTLAFNPDGSFSYAPAADYNGADSFTFRADDGALDSNIATVSLTVSPVDDAPVAVDGAAAGAEDTAINGQAAASDLDSPSLAYTVVAGPQHGVLSFNTDGSYNYTPGANYNGADSFTFKANDGSLDSNTATISLTVGAVNDAPLATDSSASGAEDTVISGQAAASDADSVGLTYAMVSGPQHGSLIFNPDGSYSYTPGANYNGPDSFTFKANDGSLDSNTATVSLAVNPVNDAPAAADSASAGSEDTVITGQAVASDVDSPALTYALVSGPQHGILTFNPDGSYSYTPVADYNGPDSFSFNASDGQLDSSAATISLTVGAVDDAPVAAAGAATGAQNTVIVGQAAASDVDSASLTYALASGPQHGTLIFNPDGSYSYTPNASYSGLDSFAFTANDGSLDSNAATISLTISAAPVAADGSASGAEDTVIMGQVAATDADSSTLTYALVSGPQHGTLTFQADGSYSYTPFGDYNGADSFTFKANDGALDSNIAAVSLTVTSVNDAPVAANGSASGAEDTGLSGSASASDVESPILTYALVSGPQHGNLTFNADGSYLYTPVADYSGGDSFSFKASDGTLDSNVAIVSLTVNPVNDAPVASAGSASGNEDATITGQAAASDVDSASLTYSIVSGPQHGTLTLNPNGSYLYTPVANYSGGDSFSFKANDGALDSNAAIVSLSVNPVNDAPVASSGSASGAEDTTITGQAAASDIDSASLTYSVVSGPQHGVLIFNPDGSYSYTPVANYNGPDSFTFKANDGSLDSNTGAVSLTVSPANDAPTATIASSSYGAVQHSGLTLKGTGLSIADVDAGSGSVSVTLTVGEGTLNAATGDSGAGVGGSGTSSLTLTGTLGQINALLGAGGTSALSYIDDNNIAAPSTALTLTVHDNGSTGGGDLSASASTTIAISANNRAPVANADTASIASGSSINILPSALLANDTDADGDPLTITGVAMGASPHGTVQLVGGVITYAPTAGYVGADSFTYSLSDGHTTSTGTVNVTVIATGGSTYTSGSVNADLINLSTRTGHQLVSGNDGNDTITGGSGNDTVNGGNGNDVIQGGAGLDSLTGGAGADTFVFGKTDFTSPTYDVITDFTGAGNGAVAGDDVIQLTGFGAGATLAQISVSGTKHTYEVTDGAFHGRFVVTYSGSAVLQAGDYVFVNSIAPAPPAATADSYSTAEDQALTIAAGAGLLANDSDPLGSPLTAVLVGGPSHGTLTLSANGSFIYTSVANYNGTDSFTYRASNGGSQSGVTTVSLTITPLNDAPVAAGGSASGAEDSVISGQAAASDVDSPSLTYALVSGPAHGTLTFNANGAYSYTPTADYNGADSFTFRASDGSLNSNTATVALTVTPVNDAPVASNSSLSGAEDTVISGQAAASDVDNPSLTYAVVSGPAHGSLTFNPNGSFSYTPAALYTGPDSFTFKANDGSLDSNTATVSLSISLVNHAPVAANGSASISEDGALAGALPAANDLDGDQVTYALVSAAAHGSVTVNPDGSFSYAPAANYNGADSFGFTVSDGHGGTGAYTYAVAIAAVNDAPTASDGSASGAEDAVITGQAVAADVDNPSLTYSVVTGPQHGVLTFNPDGSYSYAPGPNYNGADSFTFKANDGSIDSNTATVSLTVSPVNDAPIATIAAAGYGVAGQTALDLKNTGLSIADVDAGTGSMTVTLSVTEGRLDISAGSSGAGVTGSGSNSVSITGTTAQIDALLNTDGSSTIGFIDNAANPSPGVTLTLTVHDNGASGGPDLSSTATSVIHITSANHPPVASAAAASGVEDATISGALAASDVDGNPLSYSLVADAQHGHVVVSAGGGYVYTPNADYNGTDSFSFQASDGVALSNVASVSLTVASVSDAPTALASSATFNEDATKVFSAADFQFSDTHDSPANGLAAVIITALPGAGTLLYNGIAASAGLSVSAADLAAGKLTFTPAANANGAGYASFSFEVQDTGGTANGGHDTSAPVSMTLNVTPVNDAPVVTGESASAAASGSVSFTVAGLLANDTDADGEALSITGVAMGASPHGVVQLVGGVVTYTPTVGYAGTDTFTYSVSDGHVTTPGTVTVTIATQTSTFTTGTAGNDVYDYSARTNGQLVNGQAGNDSITGGAGGDALTGAAGNDILRGNGGADSLTGNDGTDIMTGGTGADTFVFTAITDFGPAGQEDVITDFNRVEGDRIRLNQVDANTNAGGDQAFTFLGTAAFTGVAGQLHYVASGADLVVSGDINGDGVADFQFKVLGLTSLQAGDFYL